MPLFIREAEVDALAEEVRKLTKARTKTEAVRQALQNEPARARKALPAKDRLARAKILADVMGRSDPSFDMKSFTHEMWGDK